MFFGNYTWGACISTFASYSANKRWYNLWNSCSWYSKIAYMIKQPNLHGARTLHDVVMASELCSGLLVLCEGTPTVYCPHKGPVIRRFDVSFDDQAAEHTQSSCLWLDALWGILCTGLHCPYDDSDLIWSFGQIKNIWSSSLGKATSVGSMDGRWPSTQTYNRCTRMEGGL